MEPPLLEARRYAIHKELTIVPFFLSILSGTVIGLAVYFIPQLYLEPFYRGFYCDDLTIRLPNKRSTIPNSVLFLCIFFLPLVGILITEFCRSTCRRELYSWRGFNVNQILVNFVKYYAYHLLAILLTLLLTTPTKYIVGELRPMFLDVCQPAYDFLNCHNRSYIYNYKCRGTNNQEVKEARLSFFSGHAALSMTTATFLITYIQSRIPRTRWTIFLKPLIQLLLVCLALYTGYTRIVDGKHHLHDVIVGYFAGAIIGYATAKYVAGLDLKPMLKRNEEKVQNVAVRPPGDDEPVYKTSIVRVEPTELRLFD